MHTKVQNSLIIDIYTRANAKTQQNGTVADV